MKLTTATATITGLRPMIMHSASMIDPENPFVQEIAKQQREIKNKTVKGDDKRKTEIRRLIEKAEWRGSIYWSAELGLYLPGANLGKAIVEGARKSKAGKLAEQGLVPIADMPIKTIKATNDIDDLATDTRFQLRSPVRIPPRTGSRIMKIRPLIPTGWSCDVVLEYDEEIFPTEELKGALETAGSLIGVGDWRPLFGRFTVKWEKN